MRTVLLALALGGFAGLGCIDLAYGAWRTGAATLLLAIANGLLLAG